MRSNRPAAPPLSHGGPVLTGPVHISGGWGPFTGSLPFTSGRDGSVTMPLNTLFQGVAPHSAEGMELDATGSGLQEFRSPPRLHGQTLKDMVGLGLAVVGPWIGCCEQSGVIEIHDPRLLRRGHEAFCLALVEAAVARFGAYRAEVSLATSTCRLEFGPGRFDRTEMARRAALAVGV